MRTSLGSGSLRVVVPQAELDQLAHSLAYETSASAIECACVNQGESLDREDWWELPPDAAISALLADPLRYLDARGLPGSEPIEVVLGKNQPEYTPLPAVYLDTPSRPMITRFRLDDAERAAVAAGADVVLQQLTFRNPFQPVNLQIVGPDEWPQPIEEFAR